MIYKLNSNPQRHCLFFFLCWESSPSILPDASSQRIYAMCHTRELFSPTACGDAGWRVLRSTSKA